jgi:stage II sporulation protein AA (anti-sigma F factor antagonist)
MAVEFSNVEGMLVIAPLGEIDHHESKYLREKIDSEISIQLPKKIVVDLSRTTFMDSSGLGLILGRYKKSLEIGSDFEVVNPGEKILKIITMSGMDKIIKVKGVEK